LQLILSVGNRRDYPRHIEIYACGNQKYRLIFDNKQYQCWAISLFMWNRGWQEIYTSNEYMDLEERDKMADELLDFAYIFTDGL
jgi:hypothetical protein